MKKLTLIIVVFLIILLGIIFLFFNTKKPTISLTNKSMPSSVLLQYDKFADDKNYNKSFGATLEYCVGGKEGDIYVVSASGGYTAERYSYDLNGNQIDYYSLGDVIQPGDRKPLVNILEYNCTVLKKSKNPVSDTILCVNDSGCKQGFICFNETPRGPWAGIPGSPENPGICYNKTIIDMIV